MRKKIRLKVAADAREVCKPADTVAGKLRLDVKKLRDRLAAANPRTSRHENAQFHARLKQHEAKTASRVATVVKKGAAVEDRHRKWLTVLASVRIEKEVAKKAAAEACIGTETAVKVANATVETAVQEAKTIMEANKEEHDSNRLQHHIREIESELLIESENQKN